MKNKYLKHSHISEAKFRQLLRLFCKDLTAQEAAIELDLNRKTVNRLYGLLRVRILRLCNAYSQPIVGTFEVDESYFGAHRVRGKRGRGARGKVPVVGILKRGGTVYTQIVRDCSEATLKPILQRRILDDSTVYTDGWKSYDGILLNMKHYRIYHSHNEFARGKNHINGIESFWSFAKRRLNRLNGIRREKFLLHLKECEWRWNNRDDEGKYQQLLNSTRKAPLG